MGGRKAMPQEKKKEYIKHLYDTKEYTGQEIAKNECK